MNDIKKDLNLYRKSFINLSLFIIFFLSLFSIEWSKELIHSGGKVTLIQLIKSLFSPDLSIEILKLSMISTWRTLVYAIGGITFAIIIGFIFGVLASGILFKESKYKSFYMNVFRRILGFFRSIHELIWAWLFVAAFGLNPFSAIFAITISYGGTLGRIFADMLKDISKNPIKNLEVSGASKIQTLFYGYLPIVKLDMISYTMYRFECAIRSSAIMSFIGLGGLGYQIQLSLSDLEYNEMWTFVFFLVLLVTVVDIWSNNIRKSIISGEPKFLKFSYIIMTILFFSSWIFIFKVENANLFSFFSYENYTYAKKFVADLLGINKNKAYLDISYIKNVLMLTFETLKMSILAIGFATLAVFITVIPAANNVANGSIGIGGKWYNKILFGIIRVTYIISRSIPELIWAMILIFIFKPGILPGAIALALHNFGILGKLCAEIIEDLKLKPLKNLSTTGANSIEQLFYGIIPSVTKKFMTYIIYRWEVILRTTIVVGFVGAGGLGQEFKLNMSFFHYTEITLLLICYICLVWFADIVSDRIRKFID